MKTNFYSSIGLIMIFIFLASCGALFVPDAIKSKFNYCYTGNNSKLDSILNISGYFSVYYSFENNSILKDPQTKDTLSTTVILFRDGIILYGFDTVSYLINNNDLKEYLHEVSKSNDNSYRKGFYDSYKMWGHYKLIADTIKAQLVVRQSRLTKLCFYEKWFKIIDNKTIIPIYSHSGINKPESEISNSLNINVTYYPSSFVHLKTIPNSDCWLKYKKWFWSDQEAYKTWKKNQRKAKQY